MLRHKLFKLHKRFERGKKQRIFELCLHRKIPFKCRRVYNFKNKNLIYGTSGIQLCFTRRYRRSFYRLLKRKIKLWLGYKRLKRKDFFVRFCGLKPCTRKPKTARMGKGKGSFKSWKRFFICNLVSFEFFNFNKIISSLLLTKIKRRIGNNCRVLLKDSLEYNNYYNTSFINEKEFVIRNKINKKKNNIIVKMQ